MLALRLAGRALRAPSRYALGLLAIAAAVAFVVAGSLTVRALESRTLAAQLTAPASATGLLRAEGRIAPDALVAVPDAVGVTDSRVAALGSDGRALGSDGALVVADPRMVQVRSGRLPVDPGEVLIDGGLAVAAEVQVGSVLEVAGPAGSPVPLTVVGLGEPTFGAGPVVAVTAGQAQALTGGAGWSHALTFVDDGNNRAAAESLREATGGEVTLSPLSGARPSGAGPMRALLIALLVVVLAAAVFVIANTFATVAASRQAQTALLRLVGATRAQVRAAALLEAAFVGVVGGVLGVVAGSVAGWVLTGIIAAPRLPALADAVLAVGIGLAITTAGAWAPARAASRTPPLEALRESAVAPSEPSHPARKGMALGLGVAMVLVMQVPLAGAVLAGVLGFALLVAIGPSITPRLAGALVRGDGPVPTLARGNIVRTPRRSARTASALVLAVSLACTGTAMSSALININVLEARFNVDIIAPTITADMVRDVTAIDGVDALSGVGSSRGRVGLDGSADRAEVRDQVEALLPVYPGSRLATRDDLALLNPLPGTLSAALGVMAAMALLLGLIGVINTVVLGIHERRGELAVLRLLGMERPALRRLVLVEALGLTAIGIVLGLALGGVTMYGLLGPATLLLIPIISWWKVLLIPVITLLAAAVAAWWPAHQVSRIDPVRAIAHL